MDPMIPAIRAAMEVDRVAPELHDLIRKVRRHLVDQAYRLTPSKIAQAQAVPAICARSRAEHGRTDPPDLAGIHGHPWRTRRMTVSLGH